MAIDAKVKFALETTQPKSSRDQAGHGIQTCIITEYYIETKELDGC
jgi:hypothetical protein